MSQETMGSDPLLPVFIAGCGRSGTSFLASMLGSHPQHITTPECQFKRDAAKLLQDKTVMDAAEARDLLCYINRHFRFLLWDVELNIEDYLTTAERFTLRDLIEHLVREYARSSFDKAHPAVWFDHDPHTFKDLDLVLKHFPNARFIHIVRDGRAVAASFKSTDWGPKTMFRAAKAYNRYVEQALAAERSLDATQILRVRYEDLVSRPEPELKRICYWLGVEYRDSMLAAEGYRPPPYTFRQHRFVNEKPNTSRIDAWKVTLTQRQIQIFEAVSGELLEQLGYERVTPPSPPPGRINRRLYKSLERFYAMKNRRRSRKRKESALRMLKRTLPSTENIVGH